jgi:hypothetical protein
MGGEAVASAALMVANDTALTTTRSAFCCRGGGGGGGGLREREFTEACQAAEDLLNLYITLFHFIISCLTN